MLHISNTYLTLIFVTDWSFFITHIFVTSLPRIYSSPIFIFILFSQTGLSLDQLSVGSFPSPPPSKVAFHIPLQFLKVEEKLTFGCSSPFQGSISPSLNKSLSFASPVVVTQDTQWEPKTKLVQRPCSHTQTQIIQN